jgi:tRNA 2-thiocytidine biosynthesis protein TtcA
MNSVNFNKLRKSIYREVGRAVMDYDMIQEGDKIMACLSGGADSYTMLDALLHLQKVAPINFNIIAVNLDQKQPGFPEHILPEYLESIGVEYKVIEKDTYSIVKEKIPEGEKTCWLCSRMRRGILYNAAQHLGATKIALGHHADDMIETLFLNMIHGAKIKGMPPKLLSDDKRNIVIRPLANCREKDIKKYANYKEFPIIPCNLCGSQENLKRQETKAMLTEMEKKSPQSIDNMIKSLSNISLSQMADRNLFDFKNLEKSVSVNNEQPLKAPINANISSTDERNEIQYIEIQ